MSNQLYPKIKKLRGELNLPYLEAEDKTKLYYRAFLPEGPQKILLCIHGLGGYSGDFIELGERLVKLNIAVYALDLRGHGLSQKEKEKYLRKEINVKVLKILQYHQEIHQILINIHGIIFLIIIK